MNDEPYHTRRIEPRANENRSKPPSQNHPTDTTDAADMTVWTSSWPSTNRRQESSSIIRNPGWFEPWKNGKAPSQEKTPWVFFRRAPCFRNVRGSTTNSRSILVESTNQPQPVLVVSYFYFRITSQYAALRKREPAWPYLNTVNPVLKLRAVQRTWRANFKWLLSCFSEKLPMHHVVNSETWLSVATRFS
jgi:hypothetical protein